jgi:hypothetical protein
MDPVASPHRPPPAAEDVDVNLLATQGHTTVRLLSADACHALDRAMRRFSLADDHAFFASPAHAFGRQARAFHHAAKALVADRVGEVLPGYEPFMIAATTKGAQGEDVRYHQDWTYTDERQVRAVFLWCPLVDVVIDNGTLSVVSGSHEWSRSIRPSRAVQITEELQGDLAPLGRPVELRAGDALVFDPATFHGSGPNRTDHRRPAVTIATVPRGTELLHFHEHPDGRLEGARVDEEFFTCHPYGTAPTGYPEATPGTTATTDAERTRAIALMGASR